MTSTRIVLLIRSLDAGGAERQLVTLATAFRQRGVDVSVAVFYGGGELSRALEAAGVPLFDLAKKSRWDVLGFFLRVLGLCRRLRPSVLHSYLDVANIFALAVKPFCRKVKVVWGIRSSNVDLTRYDGLSRVSFRLQCRLARFADLIIANSDAGADYHARFGFPRQKMLVVPNGIDTEKFHYDPASRRKMRLHWHVTDAQVLIGLAARLDPMKGYETFLKAAHLLVEKRPELRFVCIGSGADGYREHLVSLSRQMGLSERLVLPGPVADMTGAYSALDLAVSSSSFGEGFSNAIAEAMACERACVVTDVGDSARIVGDTGVVVPPMDCNQLAAGIERQLSRMAAEPHLGQQARRRIEEHFSVTALVDNTLSAFAMLHD
jgi:glycosyltransferase involved in cell wall biosynthesis